MFSGSIDRDQWHAVGYMEEKNVLHKISEANFFIYMFCTDKARPVYGLLEWFLFTESKWLWNQND